MAEEKRVEMRRGWEERGGEGSRRVDELYSTFVFDRPSYSMS